MSAAVIPRVTNTYFGPLPDKQAAMHRICLSLPGHGPEAECARLRAALDEFSVSKTEAIFYLDVEDVEDRIEDLRRSGVILSAHSRTIYKRLEVRGGPALFMLIT